MKLEKIKVESFKRVKEVELPLADLNILVGANASGKSSIIQAIHLASCVMRQSERVDSDKTSTVGIDELDYLPTDDYKTLGHGANWGKNDGTPSSTITLFFEKVDGQKIFANCRLRSARNAGISITGTVPADLTTILRTRKKFFSAYIPGISGIPNKEERRSRKVILKACSFGDSNVILRNALLLLKESDEGNIGLIEGWIKEIVGPISIAVDHSPDSDLYIRCSVTLENATKPLELAGTGYLQLIQIFCYVLLFDPGVLLIDEPDIHLHPHVQERLVTVLARVASERKIKILITTHSPFVIRGAPLGANVTWLRNGNIESQNRELVELALGWGAFGKRLILVSEDSGTALLRKLVSQWPEIDRQVAFFPGSGYKNILSPKQAQELAATLGNKFKIIVHRDRDSLTDDEVQQLTDLYAASGVFTWFPSESDVEAYFCSIPFLEVFLGITEQEAEGHLSAVLAQHAIPLREQFDKQRAAHQKELYPQGGSPKNDDVWSAFQARPLKGGKGKFVFNQLKNKVPNSAFTPEKISTSALGGQVAIDLKHRLEQALA